LRGICGFLSRTSANNEEKEEGETSRGRERLQLSESETTLPLEGIQQMRALSSYSSENKDN
jgi:hypothetical protein